MGCTNGSRKKAATENYHYLDLGDTICALYGEDSAFCRFIRLTPGQWIPNAIIDTNQFCSSNPPNPSDLAITDFLGTGFVSKALDIARRKVWSDLCECTPKPASGSPETGCTLQWKILYPGYGSGSEMSGKEPVPNATYTVYHVPRLDLGWNGRDNNVYQWELRGEGPTKTYGPYYPGSVVVSFENPINTCASSQDLPDPTPPPPAEPPNLPKPPAGATGAVGLRGPKGDKGSDGYTPIKGVDYFDGKEGKAGTDGRDGTDGSVGSPGAPGIQGERGERGSDGLQGSPGLPGKDGTPGRDGLPGSKGDTGTQGIPGRTGERGERGEVGSVGAKGDKGDDAKVEFESVSVPIVSCVDGKSISLQNTVQCIKGTSAQVKLEFERIAALHTDLCEKPDAILAYPEAWEIRPEDDRPQLIIIYREKLDNGKLSSSCWSMTIPHYNNFGKVIQSPLPSYYRGNWELIWVLTDNSKVILHGKDRAELDKMYGYVKQIIKPEYIPKRGPKIGERVAAELPSREVVPVVAKYFSTGRQSLNPDWASHF